MKILIDADGCPVVKQTIEIAKENKIDIIVFCDTSHIINSDYAKTVTVSKGADSVDFALLLEQYQRQLNLCLQLFLYLPIGRCMFFACFGVDEEISFLL